MSNKTLAMKSRNTVDQVSHYKDSTHGLQLKEEFEDNISDGADEKDLSFPGLEGEFEDETKTKRKHFGSFKTMGT
jgi:hypothetical protein